MDEDKSLKEKLLPPLGQSVLLQWIAIADVFPIEAFNDLEQGLKKLFADGTNYFSTYSPDRLTDAIARAKQSFRSQSWSNVGTIKPKDLPEVAYLEIGLHQTIDSALTVIVIAHLREETSKEVDSLLKTEFKAEDTFKNGHISSRTFAGTVKIRAGLDYLKKVHLLIQNYLSQYIQGYFLLNPNDFPCPSIRLFTINEIPSDKDKLIEWVKRNSFLDCIGGSSVPRWIYKADKHILFQPIRDNDIFSMSLITPLSDSNNFTLEFSFALNLIAISKWAKSLSDEIVEFRSQISHQFERKSELVSDNTAHLNSLKTMLNKLENLVMRFQRFSVDFEKMVSRENILFNDVPKFLAIDDHDKHHFFKNVVDYAGLLIQHATKELEIHQKSAENLFQVLNLEVSTALLIADSKLQSKLFRFTLVFAAINIILLVFQIVLSIRSN